MTILSSKIINYLITITNKTYPEEDIEVYKYGMECFLNRLFSDAILLIWSFLTGCIMETVCWLVVFCIYRNHAGGAHASTNERCIISTSLLGMSNFIAIKYQELLSSYTRFIVIFIIVTCILFAPIKSTKKLLSSKECNVHKCISLVIIICSVIVALIVGGKIATTIIFSLFSASILMIIAFIEQ